MPRRSIVDEDESTDINLSPMIDCIFILLIFFIVTTVFIEETGLEVNKPDAAASTALEDSTNVTVEIDARGKVTHAGKEVSLTEVTAIVKGAMSDPETPVVIRVNEKSRHGLFVAVWDAAKRGGAKALSFDTVN